MKDSGDPYSAAQDNIVDTILREGVASSEEVAAQFREQSDDYYDLCIAFRECFRSQPGQVVLRHLLRITVCTPTFVPGTVKDAYTNLDAAHLGFLREGQNELVRYMIRCIEQARIGPPQPPDTGGES